MQVSQGVVEVLEERRAKAAIQFGTLLSESAGGATSPLREFRYSQVLVGEVGVARINRDGSVANIQPSDQNAAGLRADSRPGMFLRQAHAIRCHRADVCRADLCLAVRSEMHAAQIVGYGRHNVRLGDAERWHITGRPETAISVIRLCAVSRR